MNEVYDRLIDSLNARGGSLPAHRCEELYALLTEIFTETEEWFVDDDTTYLYSFRNICAWLGVDFKLIREKLIEMKDVPIQVSG